MNQLDGCFLINDVLSLSLHESYTVCFVLKSSFFSPLHALERRSPEPGVGGVHPADSVKVPVEDAEAALPSFRLEVSDQRPPVLLGTVYFGRAKPLAAVAPTFMIFRLKSTL